MKFLKSSYFKSSRTWALPWLAFCALVLAPLPAPAAKGLFMSGGIGYGTIEQDGDQLYSLDPQAGLYLEPVQLGYNFTNRLGLSLTWGMISGDATGDSLGIGLNPTWQMQDVILSGRYSLDLYAPAVPYVEVGYGIFLFEAKGDSGRFVADQVNGYRAAAGVNFYAGNFFIAPEVSYLTMTCDGGEWFAKDQYDNGIPYDFDAQNDLIVFAIKVGIHFRR